MNNASIIHFIDNLGVFSAFCKGGSSVQYISCIIAAAQSLEASLGIRSWKEHVDSKANLADCGTKDVFDHVSTMGATWETLQLPPWPQDVRTASCDEWLSWYTDSPKQIRSRYHIPILVVDTCMYLAQRDYTVRWKRMLSCCSMGVWFID